MQYRKAENNRQENTAKNIYSGNLSIHYIIIGLMKSNPFIDTPLTEQEEKKSLKFNRYILIKNKIKGN